MKAGFIGLGIMGKPMAMNIVKAGKELMVYDLNEAGSYARDAISEQLKAGLKLAAEHDFKIVLEETIIGHEVEVAVLGNRELFASVPGEICPAVEFYTYDAKYNDEASLLFIPARLDEETLERVRAEAVKVFRAMECMGFARVDFFVKKDGTVVFNELNTIPGFTDISMYPKLMAATGIEGKELMERLIALALERAE